MVNPKPPLCGAALIVLASVAALTAQTTGPPASRNAGTPSLELQSLLSAVTIIEGDSHAHAWMTDLARRSPTFRDMLGVLLRAPHLRVTLRSRTDLRRTTGLAGRGMFATHDGRVYGMLEFDRARPEPAQQLRAIVHELAHAVEIACLPVPDAIAELRRQLTERKGAFSVGFLEAIETPFPNAVVRVVRAEHDEQSNPGRLRALAASFGLTLPQAEALAHTSK